MRFSSILCALVCFLLPDSVYGQPDHLLWYEQPASWFEETLVLGNGKMGASLFGGVKSDQIYLNDITLWSGEPVNPDNNPGAADFVQPVRDALKAENYRLADSLQHHLQGQFSQSYAPLGTLLMDFDHDGEASSYRRELDLRTAVSRVSYEVDGVTFQRETFISHPDQILVMRLTASEKNAISCSMGFDSQLKFEVNTAHNILTVHGYAPWHAEPSYRGDMPDAVRFDENRGTRFTTHLAIHNLDGEVTATGNRIELNDCSEAVLYLSIATSFNGFDKNPVTEGNDDRQEAQALLETAMKKPYESLLKTHLQDYQALYDRVQLRLARSAAPDLPTDKRLLRYSEGEEDRSLETLYFNFGRYLLISSSRTEGVPANLQGLWNPHLRPPWSSNYTLNINVEENYWLAETANLSELHQPLLSFLENLAETGAVTARTYYGARGWTSGHNSDIWAISNPVGDFGKGDPSWANWNMGGAWLTTHLWEHYEFTRDAGYLKETAFPLMQGAVQFCLDWMVKDEHGHWITSPGTSPENRYVTADGYIGATLYGATADLAMIRELFTDYLAAAAVLESEDDMTTEVANRLANLHPYQIGKKGNLQEWYHDWEDEDPRHRHQTHLFGLYPGHHISPEKTPELAEACKTTLEIKGDETTGWSKGWRINLWARLKDGNRAYSMYRTLLSYVPPDGMNANRSGSGGTYPNLFDAHPPFQIDGNFGGAAAVIEMLMQSEDGQIELLPALPDAWSEGSVSGICARGGFEVSFNWTDHQLTETTILAKTAGKTTLTFQGKQQELDLAAGQQVTLTW